ncbi:MAG: hypothetical protein H6937_02215 [Burkholderiales bacterium]|nr:hypothetical protein [Burkholderiales bacterium]
MEEIYTDYEVDDPPIVTHKVKIVECREYIIDVSCSDANKAIVEAVTMLDTTFPKDGLMRREWRDCELIDIED